MTYADHDHEHLENLMMVQATKQGISKILQYGIVDTMNKQNAVWC